MNNISLHMLRYKKLIVKSSLLVFTIISGCSDPESANNGNFEHAIQNFLDNQYPKCYFTLNLPRKVADTDTENDVIMHALATAGVVKEVGQYRKQILISSGMQDVTTYSYQLDAMGQSSYIQHTQRPNIGKSQGGFCFGRAQVDEVQGFTKPVEIQGVVRSTVHFSYSVVDIPEWAKISAILALNKPLALAVASEEHPFDEEAIFVLTNAGWVHQDMNKVNIRSK